MATLEPTKTSESASPLTERVRSLRLPPERAPSFFARPWVWASLTLLVAAAGAIAWRGVDGVSSGEPSAETATTTSATAASSSQPSGAVPGASMAVADSGDVVLQSTGYIVPAHQLLISPKVSGMIVALNFEEGQRVNKGDVLAELESTDYAADVAHAKALVAASKHRLAELENGSRPQEVAAAKAEMAEAQAQREQLYSQWKRNTNLRGNKTVSETDYEQSESAYKAMDRRTARLAANFKLMQDGPRPERIDAARADVLQAEADVAKALWRLGNCTIVAPISGTILKKNAEIGNVVNPVAFNGSFSLCEMADLSDLEVDLSIQERDDLARVRKGQKCTVRSEAFPDRIYEGVVSRLMPIADRAKGAVPVRVKLTVPAEEEGVYLKPEMSAVVSFLK